MSVIKRFDKSRILSLEQESTLFSVWKLKHSHPVERKLNFLNAFSRKLIIVCPRQNVNPQSYERNDLSTAQAQISRFSVYSLCLLHLANTK